MSITQETAHDEEFTFGWNALPVEPAHRHPSVRLITTLRVAFGLVWAIDAILKWLPGFRDGFGTMLDQASKAQPGWLRPMFDLWTGLSHWEVTALATISATTETFLALALISGFARKSVYLLGACYSLVIWAMGEGFGAPYQSGSTDVGAAVIYAFVFSALFLMDRSGPNAHSLDAYLETRVSWWHRVAEVGRRGRQAHTVEQAPEVGAA
jgi:nitrite reductase (NO-forming)